MSYLAHEENRYCLSNWNCAIIYGENYMFSYDSTQNIDTCVIYSPDLCR